MAGTGHVYRVLAFGPQVSDGSGAARYAEVRALVKQNTAASPFTVANEAVATALAQLLALPVPAGGIVAADEELAWASWHFGPGGQRPPPVIPEDLSQEHPTLAAATVAFDCWIANDDRHSANLAYVKNLVPVAIFDHGHALMGATNQGLARLVKTDNRPNVAGCLHDYIDNPEDLGMMADEIRGVPRRQIEAICGAVHRAGALDGDAANNLIRFLEDRKCRIMELLRVRAADFPRISEWSML